MIESDSLLQQVIRSPRLGLYAQRIRHLLDAEREARERFYEELDEGQKAEFINGEVIVHSPVRLAHTDSGGLIIMLMRAYVSKRGLGFVGYENAMVSLTRNDYMPDVFFIRRDRARHFEADQMHYPAPDLVVEILSPSTEANDRGVKFDDCAAHGVEEYWIVHPSEKVVEQYLLEDGAMRLAQRSADGYLHCQVIDGFEIPVRAVFDELEASRTLNRLNAD